MLLIVAGLVAAQPAINALAPNAGDFLDFPLDSMRSAANRAYQAAHYEEAAHFYLAALEHDITSADDIYNLACCYGLLKKDTLAALYLTRATRAGFDDIEHARHDPDFDSVRASPVFVAAIESSAASAKRAADLKGKPLAVPAETFQTCFVRLPEGFDSTKAYPLLIGLHGYGGNAGNFAGLYERAGKPKLIYAVLEAPYAMSAGGAPGYSWVTWSESDSTVERRSALMSSDYVAEACRRLAAQYHISGTWLLGFSQGCGMAYVTGIRSHDLLKGIIGFGGGFDTLRFSPADYEAAKGLRVFSAHGSEDRVVDPKYGAQSRDFLKRKGFDVTFAGFRGGHAVPEAQLKAAMKWMGVRD
jgi:phospholipase/carboxylesterase